MPLTCPSGILRPQTSDLRLQTSNFILPTFRLHPSDLRPQTFRLPTSDFRHQPSDFPLQTSNITPQTSDLRLLSSNFIPQTSDLRHQTSDFRHQTSSFRKSKTFTSILTILPILRFKDNARFNDLYRMPHTLWHLTSEFTICRTKMNTFDFP